MTGAAPGPELPRCSHGHLLLGCPDDACPEQVAHLAEQDAAMRQWDHAKRGAVRAAVRAELGMPPDEYRCREEGCS